MQRVCFRRAKRVRVLNRVMFSIVATCLRVGGNAVRRSLTSVGAGECKGQVRPFNRLAFFQFRSLLKLVFEMIAASSLVVLDMVFYEALDVIRRHAKIDYYQTGHHDLSITVKGTGMIANLLRSVVDKFNFKKNITVNLSNESQSALSTSAPNRLLTPAHVPTPVISNT